MDRKEIAQKLADVVVGIYVFLGAERISQGSGFLCNDEGHVFTAGHVINNGRPLTNEELRDPTFKIWVKVKGRPPLEYIQALPALIVDCSGFSDKLVIDLTGLVPKQRLAQPTPFLITKIRPPVIGEDVTLAGFSDELYLPFGFPRRLKSSLTGLAPFNVARELGYDVELGMLMIKSGIVGSSTGYEFSGNAGQVKGWIFFVDNGMHSGASGGPVVDENGEAFGVITERAITRLAHGPQPDLRVPSGATHAMTLEPLTAIK